MPYRMTRLARSLLTRLVDREKSIPSLPITDTVTPKKPESESTAGAPPSSRDTRARLEPEAFAHIVSELADPELHSERRKLLLCLVGVGEGPAQSHALSGRSERPCAREKLMG